MSRSATSRFLLVWLAIVWGAFFVRIDRFPLTWAPMYSDYTPKQVRSHRVVEKGAMNRCLRLTHRDGSTSVVGWKDLNIPKWNMYRLCYQRAFGKPAVKQRYGNRGLSELNRWLRGLAEGEKNFVNDYDVRLFLSINKTLGYEPDDPKFVVRIQNSVEKIYRSFDDLHETWRRTLEADVHWDEAWRSQW